MKRYPQEIIKRSKKLRSFGKTYGEIRSLLGKNIPKSTLSEWCSKVNLPLNYKEKIEILNKLHLSKAHQIARAMNKQKKENLLLQYKKRNKYIAHKINNKNIAKIALAMLCLGEATKSSGKASTFCLGNSDPRIIILFLKLLQKIDAFNLEKIRCTVQCRADQNISELEEYWQNVTGIPKRLFYKTRIDPRTIGKPTQKKNYKGVLRVDYFNSYIWIELETLADLIYNQFINNGPEV